MKYILFFEEIKTNLGRKGIIYLMKKRLVITDATLINFSFILFFSNDFVRMLFNVVFGSGALSQMLTVLIIYIPLLAASLLKPKKYLKIDFILLYFGILLFFLLSWLIHPEYGSYYTRAGYGVWDYVLLPYRGLYAYLFVRLMDSPERFSRNYKIAGWLMFVYFAYHLSMFLRRGYWIGVVGSNGQAKMSYSVSFGYNVLPFGLFFAYQALKNKSKLDWVAAAISIAMILAGGSRGPMLCYGIFVGLYLLIEMKNSKHKYRLIVLFTGLFVLLYLFYDVILMAIAALISKLGFSSRFITMILDGSISGDSGRNKIWAAAVQMIKDNPWGYGAMGSQHVITKYIYAGYPHSVVLELLIDFGVILGSILIIFLSYNAMLLLFSSNKRRWNSVFLPLFCSACCLFLSLCYWGLPSFWACIGIGVNSYMEKRRKKKEFRVMKTTII